MVSLGVFASLSCTSFGQKSAWKVIRCVLVIQKTPLLVLNPLAYLSFVACTAHIMLFGVSVH